ncbi:MAG: hypothetical protein A3C53_02540 [Omnitrophica WOR_2 bacterium RIFCSPHIGHO2_02_FULL_68_15]|nr:MAG: hypothetical protein A3C53_02540 [Omnitrophica WOR_2 bacterium RIFCSPHIGHO2_02_FULL_68_15]
MPRRPRIWFPEALYHLIVRGDNREIIFFSDADYRRYLELVAEARQRFECRLFAYALMTNHAHLMVQTGQTHSVSKFMQWLNTSYTIYVNKRHQRVGHVFQGRYHSVLVEKDSYALELSRYIHLNPVRAGMVRTPEAYRWSSFHEYLHPGRPGLTDTDLILAMISPIASHQRPLYRQFVMEGLTARPSWLERQLEAPNHIVGTAEFVEQVAVKLMGVRPPVAGVRPPA